MVRVGLGFALAVLVGGMAAAAELEGTVRVVDGDTLRLGGETVRLHGIDAPETDQRCGGDAAPTWQCGVWVTREVQARYDGSRATCTVLDRDRYGRAVARCVVDGRDIGRTLVHDGLAFAYRRYSMDYDLEEKGAAIAERGLHGTFVVLPEDHRATGRRAVAARNVSGAPEGCAIKGNISDNGYIYHLPGQSHYDGTRISEARGERWFCSEAEAAAAGWRRARR